MPITNGKKVKDSFYNYVIQQVEGARIGAINTLNYVGLECVKEARNSGKYMNQTGNLRSSIGYAVLENGKPIQKGTFERVRATASEAQGQSEALITRLAATYNKGLVLVVVAGMDYAAYVEARGYNVLNSAETLAKTLVPQMLRQLGLIK